MKQRLFFILVIILVVAGIAVAGDYNCEKVVSYTMNVSLDPETKIVTGKEILTWKNPSDKPVSEMYFHAYLNAFKNSSSTFSKESYYGGSSSFLNRREKEWGYLDVKSIKGQSGSLFSDVDFKKSFEYVHPDDDNADDETVFKIKLPAPVLPGKTVAFEIEFESKLPAKAPRTGFKNNYFFVAQWFPKVGVLINGKWNCHQFHRSSEFFADYGDYDVSITVPKKYVVGASGVMTDSTENKDGTATYRFQQECIHDFSWTAYPDYKVATRMFENSELPKVKMRLLYQPTHKKYVDDFFDATANTLKHYGLWYVPYPYPQITIIDAAYRSSAGGMEYPTLFTSGARWLSAPGTLWQLGLTVHECGHQFWYGLVGNNEFENAWMDEGFNSYSDARCLMASYGNDLASKTYLSGNDFGIPITFPNAPIDPRLKRIARYGRTFRLDPMNKFDWQFASHESYRANAYGKGSAMLWTLEGFLGEELFAKIIKTFATRFEFKHPVPQDFFNVVNEFAPQPMDWFFDQMFNGSGVLDYAVTKVSSRPVLKEKGLYTKDDKKEYRSGDEKQKTEQFESTVLLQRLGDVKMPVDVRITFETGETVDEVWDGKELSKTLRFVRNAKILRADIDPERKLFLDINYTNNGLFRQKSSFAALRWANSWLYWLQHLLEVAAFFS